jgi:hypothetical protein
VTGSQSWPFERSAEKIEKNFFRTPPFEIDGRGQAETVEICGGDGNAFGRVCSARDFVAPTFWCLFKFFLWSQSGLPDGLFSNQIYQSENFGGPWNGKG